MILHIASFTWKDEVTEADVESLVQALNEMATQIPVLSSYVVGPNLRLRPGGGDFGVAAIVADAEALDAYLDHPAHKAVYDSHLGRMIDQRVAVQLPLTEGSLR